MIPGSKPSTHHGVLSTNTIDCQTINHYITYSIITSKPELSYSSVLSTIRLYAVTSGEAEGSTYIEWTGNFSSDADAGKCYCYRTNHVPHCCIDTASSTYFPEPLANHVLSSARIGVIQDAKFKRRDALADLAKAAANLKH